MLVRVLVGILAINFELQYFGRKNFNTYFLNILKTCFVFYFILIFFCGYSRRNLHVDNYEILIMMFTSEIVLGGGGGGWVGLSQ
jgi:hypothetical protein